MDNLELFCKHCKHSFSSKRQNALVMYNNDHYIEIKELCPKCQLGVYYDIIKPK